MILSFKFNSILGSAYQSGNICFSPQKNQLFSPIGNKVTVIDLENNQQSTLNLQGRSDINHIAISPDNKIIVIVDVDGYAQVVNMISKNVISYFNFKEELISLKFSPDGHYLAGCTKSSIKIYVSPGVQKSIEPFLLHRQYKNIHSDSITSMDWSPDSRFISTGSLDLTARITNIHKIKNYVPFTFTGHKSKIVKSFFSNEMKHFYSLTKDGYLFIWKWVDDYLTDEYKNFRAYQNFKKGKKIKLENDKEEDASSEEEQTLFSKFESQVNKGRFILFQKLHFTQDKSKIQCCEYFQEMNLLIVGLQNGTFGIYNLQNELQNSTDSNLVQNIQTFSVGNGKINTISVNKSGAWIAFGIKEQGQLIVWEWRSQTYIFNQQGLVWNVECIDFSANGNMIALGGNDGKIRLFDSKSFFCFQTFSEHSSKVTDIKFSPKLNTLISCSLDGTVRAFDTQRYRNFRTMKADLEVQFNSIAIDPSGELISAGGFDPYNIYQFNLQTGNLIEVISGHSGPITCLQYSHFENTLISTSWDKTLRVHSVFERKTQTEIFNHNSEITNFSLRQDGKQVATTTFKGEIYLWNIEMAQVEGIIDCQRDIKGGRLQDQKISQKNDKNSKYYKSICYSADGEYILAGGNSKCVNLYQVSTRLLIKKFLLTDNRSLDGILTKLNSKGIKDGKIVSQIEIEDASDYEDRKDKMLPGAKKIELTKRNKKMKIEIKSVKFSPNGKFWGAASTQGLYLYSLDDVQLFTPFEMNEDISSEILYQEFHNKKYYNSLIMALQINEQSILNQIFLNIPEEHIEIICKNIPVQFLQPILNLISNLFETAQPIEYLLIWIQNILLNYSSYFKSLNSNQISVFKAMLTNILSRYQHVAKISSENQYTLEFLINSLDLCEHESQPI